MNQDDNKITLGKNMNVKKCVSYLISMIIGSGIFIVPNGIMRDAGSVGYSILIWILGGVFYAIFGALSYAELGCLMPETGGEYIYFKKGFSNLLGFLFVWSYTFIYNPAVAAFASLLFSDYALKSFYPDCPSPSGARICLAITAIVTITYVNCLSTKLSQNLGYVFNFGKIFGLLMIIGMGVYGLILGRFESFMSPFENSTTDYTKLAIAFNAGCFSYGGWSSLNNLVGEMKNPNKTLPVSIFAGLAIVMAIYLSVNVAYLTFLSPREMIASNAVAFSFVGKLIGSYSWIISIFVCLSGLGFINGTIVGSSRQIYAAATNGEMPLVFGLINIKNKTPVTSVILAGAITVLFISIKNMDTLLNIAMLLAYLFNILCVVVLLYLRKANRDEPRPFKVNLFFPIVFLMLCCVLIGMICIIFTKEAVMSLIFVISGLPVYFLAPKVKKYSAIENKLSKK